MQSREVCTGQGPAGERPQVRKSKSQSEGPGLALLTSGAGSLRAVRGSAEAMEEETQGVS